MILNKRLKLGLSSISVSNILVSEGFKPISQNGDLESSFRGASFILMPFYGISLLGGITSIKIEKSQDALFMTMSFRNLSVFLSIIWSIIVFSILSRSPLTNFSIGSLLIVSVFALSAFWYGKWFYTARMVSVLRSKNILVSEEFSA